LTSTDAAIAARPATRRRAEGAAVVVVSALVAAGAVLRHIGTKPLWRDEAVSVSVAGRPVARIVLVLTHHDANAGLYYVVLHFWLFFGRSAAWARGLSALFFVATAALAAGAGWRWKGRETGLACGLLIALNPFLLYYGQEARPYALAALLATVVVIALFWPAPRLFAAAAIALLYADLFAVLFVAALAAVVARRRPGLTRPLVVVVAAAAPLAAVMLVLERGQISWLPRPSRGVLATTITSMTGGRLGLFLVVALGVAALVGARNREPMAALAAAAVLPPLALWTAAQAVPVFIDRYVIPSAVAMVALAAAGATVLAARLGSVGRLLGIGGVGLLLVLGGQHVARLEAQPYKVDNGPGVVRFIQSQAQGGDAVAYAGGGLRTLIEAATSRAPGPFPPDVALAPGGQAFRQHDLYAREVAAPVLAARLTAVQRLWLITDPGDQRYPQGGPFATLRPVVTADFRSAATASFGSVEVTLLVRQP
jgi:mannosyltransferase